MIYIEAPKRWNPSENKLNPDHKSLFVGGGITDCPNWQAKFIYGYFGFDRKIVFLNPRRDKWPMGDPAAAYEQIEWEHAHLKTADAILFWFCAETIQPITLFELGRWSMSNKPLFVGMDPDYSRREDVEIQMKLERPDLKLVYSLEELANQVKEWISG